MTRSMSGMMYLFREVHFADSSASRLVPFSSNGLRPSRYYQTKDNYMVMASEVGVFDTDDANIVRKVCITILFGTINQDKPRREIF